MKSITIAALALFSLASIGCPKSEAGTTDGKKTTTDDKDEAKTKDKAKDSKKKDDDEADDKAKPKKTDDDKGGSDDKGAALALTCSSTVKSLGDDAAKGFTGKCPSGCTSGTIWGTGSYTTDSPICVAAVHAGVIQADAGGTVTVGVSAGLPAYKGSAKNGIKSSDWGSFDKTFAFAGAKEDAITLTCSDSVNSLGPKVDDDFAGTCPSGCKTGSVWGTDVYTTDSPICVAAVHAGVVKADDGGSVHVKVIAGKPKYEGSTKNGVKTSNWGSFAKSFTVE